MVELEMVPAKASHEDAAAALFAQDVRSALKRVIESAAFRGSHRGVSFLGYVVGRVLTGAGESLKERTLAVELFGRAAGADLGNDSIVRVAAREVRKRLAEYYIAEGAGDPIRIGLPPGSYVPVFQQMAPRQASPAEVLSPRPSVVEPAVMEPVHAERAVSAESRQLWSRANVLIASVAAMALMIAAWTWVQRQSTDFDTFWEPVFTQKTPAIVAVAHPLVYHASTRASLMKRSHMDDAAPEQQSQTPVETELLKGTDFVPVYDQYNGFGDTVAAVRFAVLLTQRSRPVRVRLASRLDFTDMRESATVLIGAYSNRWTSELTRGFRYRFNFTTSGLPCIVDASTGKSRWLINKSDNGKSNEDYIILARLARSETGRLVIIGAGLTQYGTQEAGRILTEPEALTSILKRLPRDWAQRNVELVLHSQIVGEAPTPPELAASNIW